MTLHYSKYAQPNRLIRSNVICIELIYTLFLTLIAHPILTKEHTQKAVVGAIGASGQSESTMTRAELDEHVKRFADRYYTRMIIAIDSMRMLGYRLTAARLIYGQT